MAESVAILTATILSSEVFERWCDRCMNTEPHLRIYWRIWHDASVITVCAGCAEDEAEDA